MGVYNGRPDCGTPLQYGAEISSHGGGNGLLMPQRTALELKATIGYGDAGQNGQKQISYEASKKRFAKDMRFLSSGSGFWKDPWISGESDLILKMFTDGTN